MPDHLWFILGLLIFIGFDRWMSLSRSRVCVKFDQSGNPLQVEASNAQECRELLDLANEYEQQRFDTATERSELDNS